MDQKNKKGFTLVELIVVIIVLAILATISFVSYSSYTIDARESKRATDVVSIGKALDLFYTKSAKYPIPDDIYATGMIGGKPVSYMGNIGKSVTNMLQLSEVPIDPKTQEKYLYAVKSNKKEYQVAQGMESSKGYHLTGNFKGELFKEPIKSILYAKTGSVELSSPGVPYITSYGIEMGSGIVKEYICSDMTDADISLLNTIPASMPIGNRFAYSDETFEMYYAGDILTKDQWCSLTQMAIEDSTLTTLPGEIKFLGKLTRMTLNNLNITQLPSEIGNLKLLESLNLSNIPQLTYLPNEIGQLTGLKYLSANDIGLLELPETIGELPQLTQILFTQVPINSLPSSIAHLSQLTNLEIASAQISSIPDALGNLENLQVINFSDNQISSIPDALGNLKNLSILNLWCNELTTISPYLVKLKNLENLNFDSYDCTGNIALGPLQTQFDSFTDTSELCANVPSEICIKSESGKIIITADWPYTCASQIYPNARYVSGYPDVNNTPWQTTNKNQACYFSCKIGYTGSDCNTTVALTLYDRMFAFIQENDLSIDVGTFFNGVIEFAGRLYFQVDNTFYSIDNSSNTQIISGGIFGGFYLTGSQMYFTAYDSIYGEEIHIIDTLGNKTVIDVNPGAGGSYAENFTYFNGNIYFTAYTNSYGSDIYYINPSNQVYAIDFVSGNTRSYASELVIFNNRLYFSGNTMSEGSELYSITTTNIVSIHYNISGAIGGLDRLYGVFNDRLYFRVYNRPLGDELYYIDLANNLGYYDINPGSQGSYPQKPILYNNKFYFIASSPSTGDELYYIDLANNLGLIDISPDTNSGYAYGGPIIYNNKLYYTYTTDAYGTELYLVDTSNTFSLIDINPGVSSSEPYYFEIYNNKLYFQATQDSLGLEIHALDVANNIEFHDIKPGSGSDELYGPWEKGGRLYFYNTQVQDSFYYIDTSGLIHEIPDLPIYNIAH